MRWSIKNPLIIHTVTPIIFFKPILCLCAFVPLWLKNLTIYLFAFLFSSQLIAQLDSLNSFPHFLTPSDTFNKPRFAIVLGTEATLYSAATVALYQYWYKDYPMSQFHFFNDNGEWLQQDKTGHLFTAYFETNITTSLYNWTGMKKEKAYWAGAVTGSLFQLTIEAFDGFSEKWGFSTADFLFNSLGAGLAMSQNYLWNEQRIRVKFSSHFIDYSGYDDAVQQRAENLYGTTGPEKIIKDYNGLTTWLSVNPTMFTHEEKRFPEWLMVSIGYGAEGLLGGFQNAWCSDDNIKPEECHTESLINYNHIDRYRQYYLSVDFDFTQIKTRSQFLKMLFELLSIIKIPAPAVEFNEGKGVKFYALYF